VSAAIRSLVIAITGLILAIILGGQVGNGSWVLPLLILGGVTLFGIYKLFFKAVRVEALILGFLIFGYIVGNRGFAQLTLTHTSPVYLGEAGMLACLAILGPRLALKRERLVPKTPLAWAIVAFLLIGAIRLYGDLFVRLSSATTVVTLRDAATVYYALFFFIAYNVASDPVGRRVLERFILISCVVLLPVFIIQFFAFPDLFNRITVRGYPLISQKGDLTATYLGLASFYFFLQPARPAVVFLFRMLSLIFFVGMLVLMGRASMVGFAFAAVLLLVARRPQFVFYQIATSCFVLLVIGLLQVAQLNEKGGFLEHLTDRVASMADLSGTGNYRSRAGDIAASNTQFRTVWWRTVFNETMQKDPWFGLGFGYDLTAGFMRAYFLAGGGEDTASTRSPHSIWMTMLGRMGFVGLLSFMAISLFICRDALRAARLVARRKQPAETLGHWCAVLVILGSASFGVVLEGPMAGILFWTVLGLASSQLQQQQLADEAGRKEAKKEIPPFPVRGRRFANV
jgi:O-Antigen ligase